MPYDRNRTERCSARVAIAAALWVAPASAASAGPPSTEDAMPPADGPSRSVPTRETDDPMPPQPSGPERRDSVRRTDAAMPPAESSTYRSSAPAATEGPMPPEASRGDLVRRRAVARRRPRVPAWLRQYAPRSESVELSIVAGAFFTSSAHELYDGRVGFRKLARAAGEIGARIDYFALPWFGFEFEGTAIPTRARGGGRALLAGFRGGLVVRAPWRLAPFVVGGVGALAVSSSAASVGDDVDEAFHFGGGVQFFVNRWVAVRLDFRDNISHRRGVGGTPAHHPEVLAAVALRLGGHASSGATSTPPHLPADHDGDRLADAFDHCPAHAGPLPHGCPQSDRDGDGFIDGEDACVQTFGVAPAGCPAPVDEDGDGLLVPEDLCPGVRGRAVDGCPVVVPPGAQTAVTPALADLEGVLADITFASGGDELTAPARTTASRIADILQANPGVRVEIVGHTDNRGNEVANRTLSARRAESVVRALVERGVAAERLVARGAGADEPIASNATADGRATNRRVELIVLRD